MKFFQFLLVAHAVLEFIDPLYTYTSNLIINDYSIYYLESNIPTFDSLY